MNHEDHFDAWLSRTNPPVPRPPAPPYRINSTSEVAVSTEVFWNEDMSAAPRGVKLQLLGAGGIAHYDTYNGDPFWVGWAPVPRRRPK